MPDGASAPIVLAAASNHWAKIEQYIRARRAYEDEAAAYWQSIADKRRARFAKRRNNEPIVLDDYVLTQPPVYTGPPRPPGYVPPRRDPTEPPQPHSRRRGFSQGRRRAIPLRAGPAEQRSRIQAGLRQGRRRRPASPGIRRFASTPSRPAATAPTTRRPALTARRPGRAPISPAMGYNQLAQHQHGQPAGRARRQVRHGAATKPPRRSAEPSARRWTTRSRRCRR